VVHRCNEGWESLPLDAGFFQQHFAERQVVVGRVNKKNIMQTTETIFNMQTGLLNCKLVRNRKKGLFTFQCLWANLPGTLREISVADFFTPNWLERWP
jgi:hypothetical protein